MANKAVEAKGLRMPRQIVREGRGTPGYTGNVQVYDVPQPAKGKVLAKPSGDIVEAPAAEKIDAANLTRVQLESIAAERGIAQDKVDAANTKAELADLIEQAGP